MGFALEQARHVAREGDTAAVLIDRLLSGAAGPAGGAGGAAGAPPPAAAAPADAVRPSPTAVLKRTGRRIWGA